MTFDTITYLKGRKEYLKAQTKLWESGSGRERCAQARLFEVCELLTILQGLAAVPSKETRTTNPSPART